MTYRILVVEDEPEWRAVFEELLGGAGDIAVSMAGTVRAARQAIRQKGFDCILIDIGLPDGSGLDLVSLAALAQPKADIAVCTVFEDEDTVLKAIRGGACGYILKQDVAADLTHVIAQIRAGGAPISPRIARHILSAVIGPDMEPWGPPPVRLTVREKQVLELVARGLTVRKTAEALGVAESTARSHVRNLYGKLGVKRRGAAVLEATRRRLLQ